MMPTIAGTFWKPGSPGPEDGDDGEDETDQAHQERDHQAELIPPGSGCVVVTMVSSMTRFEPATP